ncbi:MAG: class II fructose-bisphosphate aldolase [Oscillospiraceae bacterium]|jgi:fructose-bisphosphate aldolase class II|nr:class II fructose-bisphosphate aldolase [Oscillospiraceae bacterium]
MLISPAALLPQAAKEGRIIPAFNAGNMEMVAGIVRAVEEAQAPVILQIAEKRLAASPLHLLAPMLLEAAKVAAIPIAVQLDHGESREIIDRAVAYGFTGIMYDGSALPLEDNIRNTAALRAAYPEVWLEGEIGVLSGNEGGGEMQALCADPAQAEQFVRESKADCLAAAIGNAHGFYKGRPKLNFAVLEEIRRRTDVPLVLHGGTGIPEEDLAKAVRLGVCKVNIATAGFHALYTAAVQNAGADYFTLTAAMQNAVYQNTKQHIAMFRRCAAAA